jgi:hypothetical protein
MRYRPARFSAATHATDVVLGLMVIVAIAVVLSWLVLMVAAARARDRVAGDR